MVALLGGRASHLSPVPEVFAGTAADEDAVEAALEQFRRFLTS
ncbi:hypothetical protein [Microbacterium sp. bgisy189]